MRESTQDVSKLTQLLKLRIKVNSEPPGSQTEKEKAGVGRHRAGECSSEV